MDCRLITIYMVVLGFSDLSHQHKVSRHVAEDSYRNNDCVWGNWQSQSP